MNVIRCFRIAIIVLIVATRSNDASPPKLSLLYDGSEIIMEENPGDFCESERECLDCNTARLCRKDGDEYIQFAKVICKSDWKTPYCNNGYCSDTPEATCSQKDFSCPTDGTFPDPSSCTRYHICSHGVSVTNACAKNNVYDQQLRECKLKKCSSDCVTVNCAKKDGQHFVYPKDDRIWGMCVNEKPIIFGRCKDYESYDVNTKNCKQVCRRVENQPLEGKCQTYRHCSETSKGVYESVIRTCSCDSGFDEQVGECTTSAPCLDIPSCLNSNDEISSYKEIENQSHLDPALSGLIFNNVVSDNSSNTTINSDDTVRGDLVNGNSKKNSINAGNSTDNRPNVKIIIPLTISNSGSQSGANNTISGNGNVDNNLVEGSGNGDNNQSGNTNVVDPVVSGLIFNNAVSNNSSNTIIKSDDTIEGDLVNGNSSKNSINNENSANDRSNVKIIIPLTISNSGSQSVANNTISGNGNVDNNLVEGSGNGDNNQSGNTNVVDPVVSGLIFNDVSSKNSNNTEIRSNDTIKGDLVNGNSSKNSINNGNSANDRPNVKIIIPLTISNSGSQSGTNNTISGNGNVDNNLVEGNGNVDNDQSGNSNHVDPIVSGLIFNNAVSKNSNNTEIRSDDTIEGDLVNGNSKKNSINDGNSANDRPNVNIIIPLTISNSGSQSGANNTISGNGNVDNNLVEGNSNVDNNQSGNTNVVDPVVSGLIFNNAVSNNSSNTIIKSDDIIEGDLVNGNSSKNSINDGK